MFGKLVMCCAVLLLMAAQARAETIEDKVAEIGRASCRERV